MSSRLPAVLLVAALALTGCSDDGTDDGTGAGDQRPADSTKHHGQDSGGGPSSGASTDESGDAGGTGDAGDAGDTGDTVAVPVYFVGDTPQGPRLYREFRRVDAADALDAALSLVASGDALDPDYRTLLPRGRFTGADGGHATIRLPADSWTRAPAGMSTSEALLAIQQLVYTAQGVLQDRTPVTFTDAAGNATQVFGVASEDGFRAADPIRTLALVNVTAPETGARVRGTLTASGVASSFEANVPWEVRRGRRVVARGSATAEGWMDKLYPWRTEVDVSDLAPGDYVFVAMTDDPSDGEGPGPTEDTKSFTVS